MLALPTPAVLSAPFVAAFLLMLLAAFRVSRTWAGEHRVYVGDILYPLVFVALLVVLGVLIQDKTWFVPELRRLDPSVPVAILLGCGVLTLFRWPLFKALEGLPLAAAETTRMWRDLAALIVVSLVSTWMVDFIWYEDAAKISVLYMGVTALIFFVAAIALYFLGQRTGVLVSLVPLAAFGLGVAQYFVVQFKGVPVMPTDLLALETAAAVGGGYTYEITFNILIAFCVTAGCLCLLSFVRPARRGSLVSGAVNVVANLALGLVLVAGIQGAFTTIKLEDVLEYSYDRWQPIWSYQNLGFVPAFIEVAQDLEIPVPDDYTDEDAEQTLVTLAARYDAELEVTPERQAAVTQFNEIKPTVIGIMNETFSDLSIYDALREAGYNGPERYNSLSGTLMRGPLMVSVLGGGTANTEFEFLTGNSIAFIGTGKYPYQLYDLSESQSLAQQLSEAGYTATAMHPQNPVNWKRSSVYEQLGFSDFLSIEDFEGAPGYHSGVTDGSTYDKILELLATDTAPQFIFDVTMQNHGGYGYGSVPEEDMLWYRPAGVTDEDVLTQMAVYLACIERSDQDLATFIEQLRYIDRPVVLVFFGDHQPSFGGSLNDALYPGEYGIEHDERSSQTTYIVWANYEVAGATLDTWRETSASQLAAQVMYAIGAPLTDYQKAQLVLDQEIPAVNLAGYRGADGLRYALEAKSPFTTALTQMQTIQYLEFARKVQ